MRRSIKSKGIKERDMHFMNVVIRFGLVWLWIMQIIDYNDNDNDDGHDVKQRYNDDNEDG